MKKYIALLLGLLSAFLTPDGVFAQKKAGQIVVKSKLLDSDGLPVANAKVAGQEGAVETTTDGLGNFSLRVPASSLLLIEADGYETKLLNAAEIGGTTTLDRPPFLFDESNAIKIPFGTTTRRETVGAITTLKPARNAKYDNVQTFSDLLRGRVPGLLGTSNIRGIGDAVVIVDGLPRDPSTLNVEEIDQVSVLRDANAGILYGVHAPNGLILVTTKRGQAYQRRFNVMAEQGFSTPTALPNYLNSADYIRLYNEARANDGLAAAFDDATIQNHANGQNPYRYPDVDYYSREFLAKSRPLTKLLSEFSGGNKVTQYYAHLGWINTGTLYNVGDAVDAGNNRFNVRSNVNIAISDYIKTYFDVAAIFNFDRSPNGDFWSDAATLHPYRYAPILPLSLLKHNVGLSDGASLDNARLVNNAFILGGTTIYKNNVYGNQAIGGYNTQIQRTAQFNQGIEIDLRKITQGLRFRTVVGLDIRNGYSQSVNNQYAIYEPTWETNASGVDSIASLNKIGTDLRTGVQNLGNLSFARRVGFQAILDYERTFREAHTFTGTFLGYLDQFNFEDLLVPQRQAHLGLRLTYDYQKKIFANFSGALVNGYKLAPGNRAGFSPSLGLGWVLTEESLLSGNSWLDYLKIRASAGIVNYEFGGQDYMRYAQTFGNYNGSFSWDDGNRSLPTVTLQRAANPGLTFEKMKNVNIGFDSYLFKQALYLEANWFATRNSGQVVQRTIYPSYLYNNIPFENYDETSYQGVELGANWTQTAGDFTLSLGANALYATSKVIQKDEIWQNDYQYRQGRANDALFALESLGFFADEADIAQSPAQQFGEVQPGDLKYKDQNGDGKVDANDMVQIGNAQPRFSYGLTLQIKYRNLSLFALGNGQAGSYGYYDGDYFRVQGDAKYSTEVLGRWTPATAATAIYPRLSSANNSNNFRNSTFWLYKNNFFNLNRVQLTYGLPQGVAKKLFSKDFSVFLRGENLARLSQDADRRQLRAGFEPTYRNFSLGARVKF